MKEKLKIFGAILLLIILVPYMVTLFFQGSSESFLQQGETSSEFEQKVLMLLSEEISGQAELEAIKAQAVIARTELYQNRNMQVDGADDNLKQNLDRLQFCVEATTGEILTCEGKTIDGAYHAVSGKKTRNAWEVSGQEDKSYLKSVESYGDIESPDYLCIFYMEKEDFAQKLETVFQCEMSVETILEDLKVTARDSTDYVTKVKYQNVTVSGEGVRQALGLNSSCFYFSELDGSIRIMTKGLGHGLGLSQYGANNLAKEGKTYQEILKYYYTGVEITEIKIGEKSNTLSVYKLS